jgi:hypothetical protein
MAGDDWALPNPTRHIDLAPQQLTLAELATAAAVLGHNGPQGLVDWFAGKTQADIERLAEEAAVSLQARGLLTRRADNSLHLAPWLASLVQVTTTAPYVLVLSASPVKGPVRRLLVYLGENAIVEQVAVAREQVLLTNVLERKLLNQHLAAFIAPRALRAAPGASVVMTLDQVAELRTLVPDPDAVCAFMQRIGITDIRATAFEMALTVEGERGTATLYRRREPPDLDNPLALVGSAAWVMGPLGGWLMKQRVDGSNTARFAPTGRKDIRLVIERLIATPFPPDVAG